MDTIKIPNFFIVFLIVVSSCTTNQKKVDANEPFILGKGINISHWLSQSDRRGEERKAYFTESDVARIAGAGFDHIRIPADEEQLWDEDGNKEREAFQLLHNAIEWCLENDLKAVIDLHIIRSHHFISEDRPLFTDVKEAEKLGDLWDQLSAELMDYPLDKVAYEMLNEAVADDHEDWNRVYRYPYEAIRQNEPERVIILGSNRWQSAKTFPHLQVPDDPNIVLSFHFYIPIMITHYQASWMSIEDYDGPISYPGQSVSAEDTVGLNPELQQALANHDWGYFDRSELEKIIQIPVQMADSLNLPLYCGEFGCLSNSPHEIRTKWFSDILGILNENGISWAIWDYKSGGFGMFNETGTNQIFETVKENM